MRTVRLVCPQCGAPLLIKQHEKMAVCEYCDSVVPISDTSGDNGAENFGAENFGANTGRTKETQSRSARSGREQSRQDISDDINTEKESSKSIWITLAILWAGGYVIDNGLLRFFFWFCLIAYLIGMIKRRSGTRNKPHNYDSGTSTRSRGVAFFLCLFLGVIGIHHFYAGRVGMGLLYLFTAGLFGIGWFVDLIRILAGTYVDAQGRRLRS